MKIRQFFTLSLATAAALLSSAATADAKPTKQSSRVDIAFSLAAPDGSSSVASGTAEIQVRTKNTTQRARLKLEAEQLAAGSYSLDAALADASSIHLADVVVDPAAEGSDPAASTAELVLTLPADLDAISITNISLSDAEGLVVLSGSAVLNVAKLSYFANVRVTGSAPATASKTGGKTVKPKRVRGHVVSMSRVSNDVETKRFFHWVAFGAPADTELSIVVDEVAVGSVTSTSKGKVAFSGLPSEIVLPEVKNVRLIDATGVVVMEANF